jgi:hypothetical protein
MALITATPDPATATVELVLDPALGITTILRADANGTRPVRLRTGDLPASGTITVTDYEAAIAGPLFYRVLGAAAEPVWTSLDLELPRFILPSIPHFFVVAETVHGYSAGRASRATFHTVIGRDDPLVAEGRLSSRTGILDVWFGTYAEARSLEDMLARGQTAMYRQAEHPGMDMYFHVTGTDVVPDEVSWKLTANYVEVGFPPGNVLTDKTWTFTKLAQVGGSFDEVTDDYASFHDLAVGEAT